MEEDLGMLLDDERMDYVMSGEEMKIIQSPTVFSYSLDAVLLAHFAYMPINRADVLDLCSGNGIIPLLLSKRTKGNITGLEIQERLAHMGERNIVLNQLEDRLEMIQGDLRKRHPALKQSFYDVVTCNPPYFKTPSTTEHNSNDYLTIARHEVYCNLEDVMRACKLYVKPGGKVSLVHRPERLVDIITLCKQLKLEPKRMQLVYPKAGREANTLLIEAVRDGNPGLKILPPLYIYQPDGEYTAEARTLIYGK